MKLVRNPSFNGKPDAGNPHVRFDEGEQRDWRKPPVALYSTVYPVRQAKTGFSIDLKCDQHVKKVSNM